MRNAPLEFQEIKEFVDADTFRRLQEFNIAPEVNEKARSVKELAQDLGFDVVAVELPRSVHGRLVADAFASRGYRIEVNNKSSRTAQRFAVLHEMGHYFRGHVDLDDPFDRIRHFDSEKSSLTDDPQEEREANDFAAAVIFRNGALEAAFGLYGGDLEALKKHFGMSVNAIRVELGIQGIS